MRLLFIATQIYITMTQTRDSPDHLLSSDATCWVYLLHPRQLDSLPRICRLQFLFRDTYTIRK